LRDGALIRAICIGRRSPKSIRFVDEDVVVIGGCWGDVIRVDLETSKVSRARIAENGISSLARSGKHLAGTSYGGGIYLAEPSSLNVVNTLGAMTRRLRPAFAQAG
jgi:hypothetical protein